jgi:gliding motility-associated-like protein
MNKFLRFSIFCFAFISNCYAQTPDVNGILYVKAGTGGNGSSWANALSEFSDALKAAGTLNSVTAGTVKEIWVAGGTYYPLYAADYASTNNRDKAFVMVADVNLYGGFAGTETAVSQRNLSLTANKTVLSGDLGVIGDYSDNAYHVVVAANNVGTSKMDGFTISYGSSGTSTSDGTLNINGISVYRYTGGGMIVFGAAPAFTNVVICGNEAWVGAGMYIGSGAGAMFTNCLVSGNRASVNAGAGFVYNGSVAFTNVTIAGNYAGSSGGSFFYSNGSNSTFKNCIIYGNNTSSYAIGGVVSVQYSMVQGGAADATNHNLASVDPLFVNAPSSASAPFTGGDYSLTASSPVKDQGSNSLFTGLSAATTDLIGNPRVADYAGGGVIDMGALEFKQLLSQTITVADAVKTYGDADFEPVASASSGLGVTLLSSDATIANPYIDVADGNKWKIQILKAGTVTITASQAGNSIYAAATNKTFTVTINKAPLTVTANDAGKTYDGVGYSGGNGVSYSGFVNGETAAGALTGTVTYGGSSQGAVDAGSYVIVPSGLTAANYSITYVNGALTINKAALTITANDAGKVYDGVGYSGGNGVSYSGFVNGETAAGALTGTVAYGGSSQGAGNAGTYVLVPSGLAGINYTITYVNGVLTIDKAALTVTANDAGKTYDGVGYSGGNGVSYSGFVNGETAAGALTGTLAYGGTSQGAVDAGNYVIVPSGLVGVNYTITYVNGSLTINKAALTVTANDANKTYDGVGYSGGNGVSYSGFVNGETAAGALTGTLTYSGSSQGAVDAGSYVIVPSGLITSNYSVTYVNGVLTINKAALTVTATDAVKTYDGVAYSGGNGVSYSGFVNGETAAGALTGTLTYGGSSQGAVDAGSYVIVPSGLTASNYNVTYVNGALTINKAALTITANDAGKVYDGVAYSGGNGVSYSGFVNGETAAGALTGTVAYGGSSQGAVNAGTYVLVPSGLAGINYTITYVNGVLTIDKSALTVTANDAGKTYDGVGYNGGNGVSYSGFVNGETAAGALTGTLTYGGTSQGAVDAGNYVIVPSGLVGVNYTITYVNGSLTINKAALTVTANDANKTYDGMGYSGGNGVSYSGFVNGETAAGALTGTLTYGGSSQGAVDAGSYVIVPSGLITSNYSVTYVNGVLTINKAALTVTATDAVKTYDGVAYSGGNGVSYSGFVNGETAAGALTGTVAYEGSSQGAVNAGSYVIVPSGLIAANYSITYVNGALTINKAALTITANDAGKVYDGVAYSGGNGVSYSGFVNGETAAGALTGTVAYGGSSQGAVNAGTYVLVPSGLAGINYTITYVNGVLTIDKAALTVTANDAGKTYDGVAYSGGNGVSYSGFVNGETAAGVLTGILTYGGTSQGAINVNNYTIIPSGLTSNNYIITYVDGQLSINPASLEVKAINDYVTYSGQAYSGANGVTYIGFVANEDAQVLGGSLLFTGSSQGAVQSGTYDIVPGGYTSDNYTITYTPGTLVIEKAALTITAENQERCYGINNPSLTVSYNGWVNGENATALNTQAVATTIATTTSAAGTYAIVPAGATAGNYAITYVNGILTVNALPEITLSASETVLCGNNASLSVSASGNYSYEWMLDNTVISGVNTSTLTANNTGVYTAVAKDGNGCTAMAANSITITKVLPPVVAFSYDSYCAGKEVTFTNTSDISTSGNVTYTWLSGDGQTSSSHDAAFTYASAGSYVAVLTITPVACPALGVTSTQDINLEAQVSGERLTTITTTAGLATQLTARALNDAGYTWTPATGLSNAAVIDPVTTLEDSQEYLIKMDFASGCETIDTLLVNTVVRYDIISANAFTPNGDGQNDVFKVHLRGIKQFVYMMIFDRWGNKIFETRDPAKGWDGRFQGELRELGTYIWSAEGIDVDGKTIHRQGVVTLVR